MKNLKILEDQVNALTKEQQDNVLKAGRIGKILIWCTAFLMLAGMGVETVMFLKTPKAYLYFDRYIKSVADIIIFGIVLFFAEYFIIKAKVPYYSDKVCAYIKKSRKKSNK